VLLFIWLFGPAFQFIYIIPTTTVVDGECQVTVVWPDAGVQQAVGYVIIAVQYWLPICLFVVAYTRMIYALRRVGMQPSGQCK
jgi:hypothetical protein